MQMLGHWSYVNTELQERHNVGFQGWSWAQTEHMFEGFSIGQDRGQKGGYPKNTVPQDVWLKGTQRGTRVSMACGGRSAACVYAHTSGRWVGGRHEANGVSHIPSTSRHLKMQDAQDSSALDVSPGGSHPRSPCGNPGLTL